MRTIKFLAIAMAAAAPVLAAPAMAQSRAEQARWEQAQRRFENERAIYQHERELYDAAVARGRYDDRGRDPYATDYDAARYYRDDPRYQERTLTRDDYVYRGSDGRYYCRRSDGTTGLIVGAAAGGILGNVIDGGRHRTGGTLIGGALGALLGRSVEQNSQEMRCR
ncbi:hypothetical protein GCM10023232_13620 [Sphingosinicella ginsenosidimutans]|jgi:hypothetical protein|uniref:17 kDa surface antigen n=1 Tax=Allosphingosinicella ginsenosidimutans TaxID=1176539 RepID=A0A5C6TPY7_9SPHN|nr:glycine zipper 2TM domain-containing protein [Sphingosinicella ginsenosidimutans]TXC62454.1 glycine zipper 2TM domain-containing protein [Sphingosinicella ginsenosidimutans]